MHLESLADELFLEIFDYLNGIHIFRAFSGLNIRFHQLLLSHHQNYHFNFRHVPKEDFDIICQQYLRVISNRVTSIEMYDDQETSKIYEIFLDYGLHLNQFSYLKSLTLYSVKNINIFTKLLYQSECFFPDLEHLIMLDCYIGAYAVHRIDLFNKLWKLPKLNYLQLDCAGVIEMQRFNLIQTSLSIQILRLTDCDIHSLLDLLECTPNLQRLTVKFRLYQERLSSKQIISSLISLKIDFDCNVNILLHIFQCLPNLLYLTIETSSIHWNGHKWKDIIAKYFLQLKQLRFKINGYRLNTDADIDNLLDTFRTSFWLDKHQWFVGCQWNPHETDKSVILYTLPYMFQSLTYRNDYCFKSTCMNENNDYYYSFNHVQFVHYLSNNIYYTDKFPLRFPNIRHLSIQSPLDHNLLSWFPSLDCLKSLELSVRTDDDCLQLQTILDRAPCLYTLKHTDDYALSKQFYQLTSTSIRELNLLSAGYTFFFNIQNCMDLISSPLGLQCEVLSIKVDNRMNILTLIQQMSNLRCLRFTCKDVNWYSPQNKRDFLAWLENQLPSSFSLKECRHDLRYIDLWINRQMKLILLSSAIEHQRDSFSKEIKRFFRNFFQSKK